MGFIRGKREGKSKKKKKQGLGNWGVRGRDKKREKLQIKGEACRKMMECKGNRLMLTARGSVKMLDQHLYSDLSNLEEKKKQPKT